MIAANEEQETPETPEVRDLSKCEVVSEVNVRMILADLGEGLTRDEIAAKYAYKDQNGDIKGFERWMVDMIFKDPALKNKRPAAKRKVLPFVFQATVEVEEKDKEDVIKPVENNDSSDEEETVDRFSDDETITIGG